MERLVLFRAAGVGYALALKEVAEVREPPAIYPVPRAPGQILGVMNSHGRLTAVLDLASFTGHGKAGSEGKLLVLDEKVAALALWVDGVTSIISEDAVIGRGAAEGPLEAAQLETEFGVMALLDTAALVEAIDNGFDN